MTDPRAVLEAAEQATPGPWRERFTGTIGHYGVNGKGGLTIAVPLREHDAAFIALCRTAAPALAQRVVRLEEALKKLDHGIGEVCFCEHGKGNPMLKGHTKACLEARAALAGEEER
jgi:hypothetical protein